MKTNGQHFSNSVSGSARLTTTGDVSAFRHLSQPSRQQTRQALGRPCGVFNSSPLRLAAPGPQVVAPKDLSPRMDRELELLELTVIRGQGQARDNE